ncbi:hypothetical protein QJ854_gp139 [Moumouvirus goulette]|uniref:Uncharacterized protein n=1 Tax=Moumouvirus goulette TaxID=1247379 RepID=M1PHS5_9VIRU|nr:hypothetical protein QJ854_gp139 [Moumouvirus goulette]AGF85643.1 hypothetical protein glt_00838 [Moumouvirus goulette]
MFHYVLFINDSSICSCKIYKAKDLEEFYFYIINHLDEFLKTFEVLYDTKAKICKILPSINNVTRLHDKNNFNKFDDIIKKNLALDLEKIPAKIFFENLITTEENNNGYIIFQKVSIKNVKNVTDII